MDLSPTRTFKRSTNGTGIGKSPSISTGVPVTSSSQIFSVPLIMHHRLNVRGKEYYQDVDFEMQNLRDLVENPRVVNYQENQTTFAVIVEDVQWQVLDDSTAHNRWDWEGTAIVIMRSVR